MGSAPVAAASVGVRVGRIRRLAYFVAAGGAGAWYLVIVGGLAVAATLIAPRGLWGSAADRFGWSLLPVGYRVRHPRG